MMFCEYDGYKLIGTVILRNSRSVVTPELMPDSNQVDNLPGAQSPEIPAIGFTIYPNRVYVNTLGGYI